ncbi:Thioredoxin-like fold containing protein [Trema orientale]|uniref:Thioredoxin-like fold containing protein n=1 Tax=Trema orientale TaxID=63057 RepID=A0A2P5EL44_TREOI|nr:Thioredoxin-like fold containing protein [Trema orientale]
MPLKLLEATTKTPLPLLVGALLEATSDDVALLRAYVGDRPTWSNPRHPWRVDSKFKLTGVPTLIRWENDTMNGRLEDYEAHLEDKIDALLAGK